MKKSLRIFGLSIGLSLACLNVAKGALNPPLCIDSICVEDEVGKIRNLDWKTSEPASVSQAQWDKALAFWGTIFPEAKESSLRKLRQNLIKRRIDPEFIDFLEKRPPVCRFEGFRGWIVNGDELLSVNVAPDVDYQWRVIRITKYYRNIPSSDHVSSYLKAVKSKYPQWAEDDYWGDAEAPVNWDENPHNRDNDFSFSLRHLVSYGYSRESAMGDWALSFDNFVKHREHLSEGGSRSEYDKLYKKSEACTPKVTL